ncbi:DUF3800 domain-containing protein [Sinorhizobium fredii]|uniref:DUF3800 domain-containing protein n=1 Tax=Rhizobium fredii TaxID=380 RepID=UPI003518932F
MSSVENAFISACRASGNTLVFVDDTDFHGAAVASLAPDLRVLTAIKLESACYAEIESAMRERLASLGQTEFHVAEIVNPKRESAWRNASHADRIAALALLSSLIERANASMRYAWISKGQYEQMRKDWVQSRGEKLPKDRNAALKRVVLRALMEELSAEGRPAVIMIDQDRPRPGIEIDKSENAPWLIGGGVMTAPSQNAAGLQLADALAFGLGRRFRRQSQLDGGTASDLDIASIGPLAALDGRSKSLLG